MSLRIRPALASIPVYKPGKPAPIGPGGVSYKLSSNENPFPPLPGVLEAAERAAEQMNRYPDNGNPLITAAVADRLKVGPEQLAFGTGAVAVLYHLLQALCEAGDEVIYAWRSFEAYPIAVQLTGATSVRVPLAPGLVHDLAAMKAAITPATRAILICSPNNPTGPALGHDEVVDFVEAVPDHIAIMIDEAYLEFVTDPAAVRGVALLEDHDNVVVLRTFSKAYGLAGFRIGYCVAEESMASAVRAAALPFGVSTVAQAAAVASLEAEAALFERVDAIVAEREILVAGLIDLGFEIPSTQGNFVWLRAGSRTGEYVDRFAAEGLMVRPYASGEPADGILITVGDPDANRRVLAVAAQLND